MYLTVAVLFLGSAAYSWALTEGQCVVFAVNGTTAICHATGSPNARFVPLDVPVDACINGHVEHDSDYVAVGDPACQGVGCLPQNAPCDPTLPCCEGLACTAGLCAPIPVCAPEGAPCAANEECCSGNCAAGVCAVPEE
jgi:hypothetical protein